MESVVKNCGQTVHDEVANKQTMEELKEILKAPDWVDAEECHRCRVQFGVVTRKHHCRACGQIFCGKCSSKYSTIPKFGIEKENSSAPLAEDIDPELARYLNRNYWEKKQEEVRKSPTPSAPLSLTEPAAQPGDAHPAPLGVVEQQYQNGESEENHEQFLKALQNAVTTFVNRMKSNHMRGRSITNDSAVLSLFQSINNMHPQLLELLNQLDERRRTWELWAGILGSSGCCQGFPPEYLEMQRQLAIQRLQEQEKERQMRLEQQKQTIQMRAQMPAFSLPYAQLQAMPAASGVIYQPSGPTSFPGTFSPAGSVEGSPMHSVYMNQAAQGGTGPYTAMPVTGTDPGMVNAYMYQPAAGSGQAAQQGPAVPTTTPAYSSYQPTPTQGYQTAASQSQSIPAISQAPQSGTMGYMGSQSVSMGYQPYSMQGLMSALPGQEATLSSLPAQQSYLPGQQPLYQQMAPPGGPPQQQPPPPAPAPAQQPQGSGEAQLISFD
ncbi:hepatocyte growth factor-regulated tyrosine kinase substrate isoform x1 [Limosa lapponica baueri]|uniref:Hepatocyte growth factor-regulated tyrosine kinase substrate n=1 Tax=Limosa lapponica baueri TaxID=1758121 RepID=A0A2I0TBM6_LIMLA|nr:hepatocyte growth factor-regulated tyrosine kinase substrate isoform x1 [Limosa lapponica baueri]